MPKVTHELIATRAGVSRTVVTQALHGTRLGRVNPETRREIQRIARELGYKPRAVTTHAIGCLINPLQLHARHDLLLLTEVEKALNEAGYRLTIVNPDSTGSTTDLAARLNPKTVDGLLLTSWSGGRFRELLSPEMPCVLLSEEPDADADVDQVGTDLTGTLRQALRHLAEHGHRGRAALITGVGEEEFYHRVGLAFVEAARSAGWPETGAVFKTHPQKTPEAVRELTLSGDGPTAIIVSDFERAMAVFCALLSKGYRIPDDISLISLFDDPLLQMMSPTISATNAGGAEPARQAVRLLLEKIADPELPARKIWVRGDLLVRGSVGRPQRV